MKLDAQVVGNAGLYLTCYQLSLLGWNVMPTARNARGIDVVAYSRDGKRYLGIQVKSLSKRSPVPLGTSLDNIMGNFWVIINRVVSEPVFFILTPDKIKMLANPNEKDGRVSYWLEPKYYEIDEFRGGLDGVTASHKNYCRQPVINTTT